MINPRLFPDQVAFIIDHADDSYVFFDMTFAPLVESVAPQYPNVKGWIALGDASCIAEHLSNLSAGAEL